MNPSRNHHQNQPDTSSWNHNQHLGINKLSKPIRKSSLPPPPPVPSFQPDTRPVVNPQPHVYNVSKSDFRDIVQQLTGTPSRDPNPSALPQAPVLPSHQRPQASLLPSHQRPNNQPSERLQKIRPPPLSSMQNPSQIQNLPSPLTSYMQFLESSLLDTSRHVSAQSRLLPSPVGKTQEASVVASSPPTQFPSPAFLQSPTAFANLISPIGFQYPNPLTRNPGLSPGILRPMPGFSQSPIPSPALPLSPGFLFPNSPQGLLSPSNSFPIQSPIWRHS
ncbi:VQ motif-containing protein [Rhynchospora pubera]|uniref:VQ motif-containing protein n=1 Tax=Rhynchospora pubera TaxID=906938 RepID=A0AAV8EBG2_9POAL|nr:VQ motif-containing protein [Rhynchospora pubera]